MSTVAYSNPTQSTFTLVAQYETLPAELQSVATIPPGDILVLPWVPTLGYIAICPNIYASQPCTVLVGQNTDGLTPDLTPFEFETTINVSLGVIVQITATFVRVRVRNNGTVPANIRLVTKLSPIAQPTLYPNEFLSVATTNFTYDTTGNLIGISKTTTAGAIYQKEITWSGDNLASISPWSLSI